MTRTEERLTDALAAKARTVPDHGLRPLTVRAGRRTRLGWVAPVAAAAGVALAVGLAVLAARLSGLGQPDGAIGGAGQVPRYYVQESLSGGRPVVRSTATGKVTATVPAPDAPNAPGDDIVASAGHGLFFVAAFAPGVEGERLYQFRLTGDGLVTGFAPVPGGPLGGRLWMADAMAASPDGSRVALSLNFAVTDQARCGHPGQRACKLGQRPDYIVVVNTATGAKSVWRGGTGLSFGVASLSWTSSGDQLVYLGQHCRTSGLDNETCVRNPRTAEVRALNPAATGGQLDSGPVLLRQSAQFPYIVQAVISPDGSSITAVVLRGRTIGNTQINGVVPQDLSVEQISIATGKRQAVLYQRRLGPTPEVNTGFDFVSLSPDAAGQHLLLNVGISNGGPYTGVNGWIHQGRLVPLPPVNGREADEAW